MDFETPHQQRVPAPSTLENAATGPPNQTLKSRRRPASPAKPADARPKKRSPNYVHTQAASPAVISSLIDQLSAISIPAHDHFENLLVGYSNGLSAASVTSVNTGSRGNSSAGQDGSSVNHSAYNHSIKEQNDLFPTDDAFGLFVRHRAQEEGKVALAEQLHWAQQLQLGVAALDALEPFGR
jgi:hypothetical protein